MLSVKQGGIKYQFLSLWYDSTWDWTPVSRTIGEHSNHYTNAPIIYIFIYLQPHTYMHGYRNKSNNIEKKLINKVIQEEEWFNVKESRCYKVSVLMNHHQD